MDDVFSSLRKLLGRGKPAEEPGPETELEGRSGEDRPAADAALDRSAGEDEIALTRPVDAGAEDDDGDDDALVLAPAMKVRGPGDAPALAPDLDSDRQEDLEITSDEDQAEPLGEEGAPPKAVTEDLSVATEAAAPEAEPTAAEPTEAEASPDWMRSIREVKRGAGGGDAPPEDVAEGAGPLPWERPDWRSGPDQAADEEAALAESHSGSSPSDAGAVEAEFRRLFATTEEHPAEETAADETAVEEIAAEEPAAEKPAAEKPAEAEPVEAEAVAEVPEPDESTPIEPELAGWDSTAEEPSTEDLLATGSVAEEIVDAVPAEDAASGEDLAVGGLAAAMPSVAELSDTELSEAGPSDEEPAAPESELEEPGSEPESEPEPVAALPESAVDPAALEAAVRRVLREELDGGLGQRLTQEIARVVREEIEKTWG